MRCGAPSRRMIPVADTTDLWRRARRRPGQDAPPQRRRASWPAPAPPRGTGRPEVVTHLGKRGRKRSPVQSGGKNAANTRSGLTVTLGTPAIAARTAPPDDERDRLRDGEATSRCRERRGGGQQAEDQLGSWRAKKGGRRRLPRDILARHTVRSCVRLHRSRRSDGGSRMPVGQAAPVGRPTGQRRNERDTRPSPRMFGECRSGTACGYARHAAGRS